MGGPVGCRVSRVPGEQPGDAANGASGATSASPSARCASRATRTSTGARGTARAPVQLKMLTAREMTTATVSSEASDWTIMSSFAQAVSGMVSVGLNAVALVNDV